MDQNTVPAGLAPLLLIVEVTVLFGVTPADPDLYGHLTFGSEILKRGTVPTVDTYSYTAGSTYWINHEWLAEVLFATVKQAGGFQALHGLKILFLGLYFYLFYGLLKQLLEDVSPLQFGFFGGLFALILYPYLFVRPQLVTFLMTQLFLLLLLSHLQSGDYLIYLLPVLFVVWTNAHGGFVAGLGLLAVSLPVVVYWYPERRRSFPLVAGLCLLGTLINPYGYHIYEQLLRTFSNPYTDRLIQDWQSVLNPDVAGHPVILTAAITYVTYALLFLYSDKPRKRIVLFVLTSICFLVGLTDARNMVFIGLVGLPSLAEITSPHLPDSSSLDHGWLVTGILVLMLLLGFGGSLNRNPDGYFPAKSVRFLKQNNVSGNLAVPFNWGQYCIYHLHPSIKVSLDGRYDTVYPLEVFEDFQLKAFQGRNWKEIFRRYGTDYVLVPVTYPLHEKLINSGSARKLYGGRKGSLFKLR